MYTYTHTHTHIHTHTHAHTHTHTHTYTHMHMHTSLNRAAVLHVCNCIHLLFFLLLVLQLGGEAGVSNPQLEKMKVFFRAMAILLIPLTSTFPSVCEMARHTHTHTLGTYFSSILLT